MRYSIAFALGFIVGFLVIHDLWTHYRQGPRTNRGFTEERLESGKGDGMPATVRKIKGRWRVVEPGGALVKNKAGTPVDGGGHSSKSQAERQARAINSLQRRKR